MYIAPSLLSADFTRLGEEIASVSDAELLHFDVMDGHFVPNISVGLPVLESVRKITDKSLDVHLMISEPQKYVTRFCEAGANLITFHIEACSAEDAHQSLRAIRSYGCMAGLAIKPGTSLDLLIPLIPAVELICFMTVEPGFGGQSFMHDQLSKLSELRRIINSKGHSVMIEIDGGINPETARTVREYGANIAVAGNDIFSHPPDHRNARLALLAGD